MATVYQNLRLGATLVANGVAVGVGRLRPASLVQPRPRRACRTAQSRRSAVNGVNHTEPDGGGSGIRTHETRKGLTDFKSVAFNHSAIPPETLYLFLRSAVAKTNQASSNSRRSSLVGSFCSSVARLFQSVRSEGRYASSARSRSTNVCTESRNRLCFLFFPRA